MKKVYDSCLKKTEEKIKSHLFDCFKFQEYHNKVTKMLESTPHYVKEKKLLETCIIMWLTRFWELPLLFPRA